MRSGEADRKLLIVASADVRRALPMADCIEAVERAMRAVSRGDSEVPLRTIMTLPGGRTFFGAMPGYLGDPRGLGAKILTVYPENPKSGLPSHVGLVVLFDTDTGMPVAVMDAAQITALRTAAASAVATRALARQGAAHLAILGTGEQASTHLEAIAKVRALQTVRVWGRSRDKAAEFAEQERGHSAVHVEVSKSARDAVSGADIVCTVTGAREPILNGAWLSPGTHVNLVGASQLSAREADDDLVARSRFFVDSRVSARAEAGELRHAIDAGCVTDAHVLGEIGEVLNGTVGGRAGDSDVTVYKSLGIAAQDLAAARVIWDRAARADIGVRVPF